MRGTLAAENVTKEYGATVVLDGLSLVVPPAARIGVVGPNGAGKSTLLRILAGIEEPDAGRVVRRPAGLRVAYLAQEPEQAEQSGGEAARAAVAALRRAEHDVLCLDEPTNNLDFAELERLERFVREYPGAIVLVSHDREFLDRTVTRIVAFDAETRRTSEFAGTYGEFTRARSRARETHHREYERFVSERDRFLALRSQRREQARVGGAMADRRGTNALRGKVRQAERRLERLDEVEKPWQPWRLELALDPRTRGGDLVARLRGAVVERGAFRLGPVDVEVLHGDRVAISGRNGAGKTTLLRAITGDLPLARGTREVGPGVVFGELDQQRALFSSGEPLLARFAAESALRQEDVRTLLAKFALGADEVLRPASSLSPGERSRAVLALLQARGVNTLVLDEPTNHLDLEAIEQLELALEDYPGTVLLVTHDRRFLERFAATRTIAL